MKFFWVDTETTGLDPKLNGIIQIAGIMLINGIEVERFNLRCRPHENDIIDETAFKSHGVTKEEIMSYASPQSAYGELKTYLDKHINKYDKNDKFYVAGKNVRFDMEFLHHFFLKNGTPTPKYDCPGDPFFYSYVWHATFEIETLGLLYELCQGKKIFSTFKLENMCKVMGVPLTNAHDAMADIEASRQLGKVLWAKIKC